MKAKDPTLSINEVRLRFAYDVNTGKVTYKTAPPNQPKSLIGKEAGYIRDTIYGKYRVIKIGSNAVYAHRLIWFMVHGKWPEGLIDHENGNRLDNRLKNLRPATQSSNKANGKRYRNNTSGYKGVTKFGLRWRAQITHEQKVIYLGLYDTKEEAHAVYLQAANELHGKFTNSG